MKIAIYIFMFTTLMSLTSCGARKSEKSSKSEVSKTELTDKSNSEQSEVTKTNSDINIKKSETRSESNQDQTVSIKEVVEPVDPNKPASFTDKDGKKQELNNSKKTIETTLKKNNSKTEIKTDNVASVRVISENNKKAFNKNDVKLNAEAKKDETAKQVDRKEYNPWVWVCLLILFFLIAINWKIIKEKIWWI